MKTKLWTVDFDLGFRQSRLYVSAPTVKIAIRNAVFGYNRDVIGENVNSKQITIICQGQIEGVICETVEG